MTGVALATTSQPPWGHVLAVVAHPDDESFGLGALLSAFVDRGSSASVLCLTHGEASTLGVQRGDLGDLRESELAAAASVLGLRHSELADYPDGGLDDPQLADKVEAHIGRAIDGLAPDGLLVFDPVAGVTGHADHAAASNGALRAARKRGLDVVGWALPTSVSDQLNAEFDAAFAGHPRSRLTAVGVDRSRQLEAVRCHASQAVPGSVLWRRLELLGNVEYVRTLSEPRGWTEASRLRAAPS